MVVNSSGVWRECRPRPPQTWMPSSPESGASPRLSAPITLVVTPEECQSIPMTLCDRARCDPPRPGWRATGVQLLPAAQRAQEIGGGAKALDRHENCPQALTEKGFRTTPAFMIA